MQRQVKILRVAEIHPEDLFWFLVVLVWSWLTQICNFTWTSGACWVWWLWWWSPPSGKGPRGCVPTAGDHTCEPLSEGLCPGTGEASVTVRQTSDLRGAVWFPSWLCNWLPALRPCQGVRRDVGVYATSLHVFLFSRKGFWWCTQRHPVVGITRRVGGWTLGHPIHLLSKCVFGCHCKH